MGSNDQTPFKRALPPFVFIVFSALLLLACKKTSTDLEGTPSTANAHYNCLEAPNYGDSILNAQWLGPNKDYIITPINHHSEGKYYSWPSGLEINQNTGAINVTKSESGARYIVAFLKNGSTDTCVQNVIIGGITYLDNIYVLGKNEILAKPYFNANPAHTGFCDNMVDGNADDDGESRGDCNGDKRCEFDDNDDDDNGNGLMDEPKPGDQVNDVKIMVHPTSGTINLKKTLYDGAFGFRPKNGDFKDATIYYKLNDLSNKALRNINVRLVFYEKENQIPSIVVKDISQKRFNFFNHQPVTLTTKPRPPLIIITRQ